MFKLFSVHNIHILNMLKNLWKQKIRYWFFRMLWTFLKTAPIPQKFHNPLPFTKSTLFEKSLSWFVLLIHEIIVFRLFSFFSHQSESEVDILFQRDSKKLSYWDSIKFVLIRKGDLFDEIFRDKNIKSNSFYFSEYKNVKFPNSPKIDQIASKTHHSSKRISFPSLWHQNNKTRLNFFEKFSLPWVRRILGNLHISQAEYSVKILFLSKNIFAFIWPRKCHSGCKAGQIFN